MSYFTNVRYGKMLMVGRFKTERQDLRSRDRIVVRTDRGKEIGEILTGLEQVPESLPPESLWDILRRADPADLQHAERLEKESVPRARQIFKETVQKLNMKLKLVDIDCVFGGERVIFYFKSEARVDFRELVRHLAHEFRTRIELKQVGARDEARLVGDIGHCGLTLCCRSHLKELGGITMDMAKVQKHTADPSKITGRCGKLLCCLRYEYSTYTESRDVLPARGARIESKGASGVVVDQNMLLREVTVEKADGERAVVKLEEITGGPKSVVGCSGCATPAGAPAAVEPAAPAVAAASAPASTAPAPRPARSERIPLWFSLGKAADFAPGAGKAVDLGGLVVAVFNVEGQLHVTENACAHQGGPLGEGKLEGALVTCPLHQWKFEVTTGRCVSISGSQVRKYESAVSGDELFVKV